MQATLMLAALVQWLTPPLAACALLGCGSDNAGAQVAERGPTVTLSVQIDAASLPNLFNADAALVDAWPAELGTIARPGADIDANGRLAENRENGEMLSPRFQLGAGAALRVGLHQPDSAMASAGLQAIAAGLATVSAGGAMLSTVPPFAPTGTVLQPSDHASAAAFFLADACPALLALDQAPQPELVASPESRGAIHAAVARAMPWLSRHRSDLMRVDGRVPNRLLYDALAFHSCSVLTTEPATSAVAADFVAAALRQTRPDGVFVERDGSDTTYQAVSVRLSLDLLLTGYDRPDRADLSGAWQRGAVWLANRIRADGRIDSTRNTRTCAGGESFLGRPKRVWPPTVFAALAYAGRLLDNPGIADAATRLSAWARANPRTDPCFP